MAIRSERDDSGYRRAIAASANGERAANLLIVFSPLREPFERHDVRADDDETRRHRCARVLRGSDRILKTSHELARQGGASTVGLEDEPELVFFERSVLRM